MTRPQPKDILGFDPYEEPIDLLRAAIEKVRRLADDADGEGNGLDDANDELDSLVESLDDANCLVCWTKIDDNDRKTWPTAFEPCLALVSWSKGKSCRFGRIGGADDESHEAVFYEPCYGFYCRKRDLMNFPDDDEPNDGDELVFAYDHGEQDYNDEDSWREAPKWWAKIATPQTLQMEFPKEKNPNAAP